MTLEDKIRDIALRLFPVDPEYDSEPYEDGSYPVIDMNQKRRDDWIEDEFEKYTDEELISEIPKP